MAELARQVPILLVDVDEEPIFHANHFVVQHNESGEFFLTLSQVAPPPTFGSDETQQRQIEEMSYVAAHTVARVSMNRARLAELIDTLSTNLQRYDTLARNQDGQ